MGNENWSFFPKGLIVLMKIIPHKNVRLLFKNLYHRKLAQIEKLWQTFDVWRCWLQKMLIFKPEWTLSGCPNRANTDCWTMGHWKARSRLWHCPNAKFFILNFLILQNSNSEPTCIGVTAYPPSNPLAFWGLDRKALEACYDQHDVRQMSVNPSILSVRPPFSWVVIEL